MLKKLFLLFIFINFELKGYYPKNDLTSCYEAREDAINDTNAFLWFSLGFLFSFPIGFPLLPFLISSSPPSSRLLGKSPEYVNEYLKCYKEKTEDEKLKYALLGCVVSTGLLLLIIYLSNKGNKTCIFPSIELGGCSSSSSGCPTSNGSGCSSSNSGCSSANSGCSSPLNLKTGYYTILFSLLLSSYLLK